MPQEAAPSLATPRDLATELLTVALTDLEAEARASGRDALFAALRPWLGAIPPATAAAAANRSQVEFARALQRLRQRLRERVDARLRAIEPDPQRRRQLRRQLHRALRSQESSS